MTQTDKSRIHYPVMLNESISAMNLKPGQTVVDCTVNRGGHSIEIARIIGKSGTLVCFDLDNAALDEAKQNLEILGSESPKIYFINSNFRNIEDELNKIGIGKVDAVIADLGVSSEEIDISGRGFTFQKDEPLLMTLKNPITEDDITAEHIVNNWSEETISSILYAYADENYRGRIARNICEARRDNPITTTQQLVEVIRKAVPISYTKGKTHFATRTFQALRMAVNDEMRAVEDLIKSLPNVLVSSESRASVITFHSTEDRIVKIAVKENENLEFVNKKVIEPSENEIKENIRSRSAKLRVIKLKND